MRLANLPKGNVFGFTVVASDIKKVSTAIVSEALVVNYPCLVAFADAHVMSRAATQSIYGAHLRTFDLICPDGRPVTWKLNMGTKKSEVNAQRITGPDTMLELFRLSEKIEGVKHFLLGSTTETLDRLVKNLKIQFPKATIVGVYSPPFGNWTLEENKSMGKMIQESGANLVWVGLGCPKQETWIAANAHILPPAVYLAVGAAFNYHAGEKKRAPMWMQKGGLEWFYRLVQEPRRLWKRYLVWNSMFIYCLLTRKGKM